MPILLDMNRATDPRERSSEGYAQDDGICGRGSEGRRAAGHIGDICLLPDIARFAH
jgi:hypothetical protein